MTQTDLPCCPRAPLFVVLFVGCCLDWSFPVATAAATFTEFGAVDDGVTRVFRVVIDLALDQSF